MDESRPRRRPRVVVFDIGNVLIEWDPRHLYRKIFSDDEARMEHFLATICDAAWNLEQDHGRSWAEAVAERAALHPEWREEIAAYDARWMEMVPGAIAGSIALLERLRQAGVPTYAITNFSTEKFVVARERFPFLGGFEDVVVSGEVGLVKPDPAIFALFLARNGLEAADCLFVDDIAINIETARAMGFITHPFTTPEAFAAVLRANGFPV
ncbi:HAD family hydrolase [Chelatococcus sp. GCM10030263]|uniref:HAD family hydrolase n=1 Tax=Chelatococcus sp. GCM10030263 TaxID=3273387 RepID=UPI00361D438E